MVSRTRNSVFIGTVKSAEPKRTSSKPKVPSRRSVSPKKSNRARSTSRGRGRPSKSPARGKSPARSKSRSRSRSTSRGRQTRPVVKASPFKSGNASSLSMKELEIPLKNLSSSWKSTTLVEDFIAKVVPTGTAKPMARRVKEDSPITPLKPVLKSYEQTPMLNKLPEKIQEEFTSLRSQIALSSPFTAFKSGKLEEEGSEDSEKSSERGTVTTRYFTRSRGEATPRTAVPPTAVVAPKQAKKNLIKWMPKLRPVHILAIFLLAVLVFCIGAYFGNPAVRREILRAAKSTKKFGARKLAAFQAWTESLKVKGKDAAISDEM